MNNALDRLSTFLSDKVGGKMSRFSDVFLAVGIFIILTLMIVPMPPIALDALIAINLTIGCSLIFVAIYIPAAIHLSIFPSLLLFTTLFRLGLNIGSTRGILTNMDGGQIISAFGNFVTGGNLVVGLIIFLIITLVQFIVITKGAERVAEVAARFTLDAMPGKQMSIDADMRAGMLDAQEARKKRLDLQKESQLYGAMDGAMKFVKGDAIAGIVITLINLVGGIIIGSYQFGLSVGDSLAMFAKLSVGDGLVSQIPALLISITAGIVTTRVSTGKGTNLGQDIATQILKQPKGLLLASFAIFALGFLPGFPTAVLWIISGLLGLSAYMMMSTQSSKLQLQTAAASAGGSAIETGIEGHTSIPGGGVDSFSLTIPVILETGSYLSQVIKKQGKSMGFIEAMIPKMRQALYHELGVRFPGVHVRVDSDSLEEDEYSILLNEVPMIKGKVIKGYLLTSESEEALKRYNLSTKVYKNTQNIPSVWVKAEQEEILKKAGIKYWGPIEVMILHLSAFYKYHSNQFLGVQEVRKMIEFAEKSFPDLVKEVTRLVPLQKLAEIFKRLAEEQISIKDIRTILECLSERAQTEKDTVFLTEFVRQSLNRYISYKYAQGQSIISAYVIDPEIEQMIRDAIKQTSTGAYLALDPDSVQLILTAVRNTIVNTPTGGQQPVVVATVDVRRFVKKLIETEKPEVAVISYQEVISEMRIQPLGRIQLT